MYFISSARAAIICLLNATCCYWNLLLLLLNQQLLKSLCFCKSNGHASSVFLSQLWVCLLSPSQFYVRSNSINQSNIVPVGSFFSSGLPASSSSVSGERYSLFLFFISDSLSVACLGISSADAFSFFPFLFFHFSQFLNLCNSFLYV